MLSDKFKPPTKTDFLLVFYAALGGLAGGLGLSIMEGHVSWTNLLMGTLAGVIGVIIFNIDRSDWPRLVVAAMLCGVSWQSVMDTGRQFINVKAAESNSTKATEILASIPEAAPEELPSKIDAVAQTASQAVENSAGVKSPDVQTKINNEVAGVVTKLNDLAPKDPNKVIEAFATLGHSANRSGNLRVWKLSSESLKNMAANERLSPAIRASAVKAYEAVKVRQ